MTPQQASAPDPNQDQDTENPDDSRALNLSLLAELVAPHGDNRELSAPDLNGTITVPPNPDAGGKGGARYTPYNYKGQYGSPASRAFSPEVESAIQEAAARYGLNPEAMHRIAQIESGGDPRVTTPSGTYQGLFQLSNTEFQRNGGGDILSARDNAMAAARKIQQESQEFQKQFGRLPNMADIYLIHQQGMGGASSHWANPDQPAWMSMYQTAEGRNRGEGWAKRAIWGNVPSNLKAQYGSVEQMTSAQFVEMWAQRTGTAPIFANDPVLASTAAPTTANRGDVAQLRAETNGVAGAYAPAPAQGQVANAPDRAQLRLASLPDPSVSGSGPASLVGGQKPDDKVAGNNNFIPARAATAKI